MLNILVVDDETMISDLISDILTQSGYNVETASEGRAALQLFEKNEFDLVITDVFMPGIDGFGVARHIRNSNKPETPIIAISGTPWDMEKGTFDSIIPKPFSLKTLLHTIKELKM